MSGEAMEFPKTWEEFEKEYGFTDKYQQYTNGSRLIQSLRVKQWLDHIDTNKTEAYKIVLDDLKKINMFRGKYDAKNGNRHFMYGVLTVMEHIAEQAGDEYFTVKFADNMTKSEERT